MKASSSKIPIAGLSGSCRTLSGGNMLIPGLQNADFEVPETVSGVDFGQKMKVSEMVRKGF